MNANILKRCVEELKKEGPDLSYIRGTLETLIEMEEIPGITLVTHSNPPSTRSSKEPVVLSDEDVEYGRKMAGGPIGKIG